jgi:hypothetical protein
MSIGVRRRILSIGRGKPAWPGAVRRLDPECLVDRQHNRRAGGATYRPTVFAIAGTVPVGRLARRRCRHRRRSGESSEPARHIGSAASSDRQRWPPDAGDRRPRPKRISRCACDTLARATSQGQSRSGLFCLDQSARLRRVPGGCVWRVHARMRRAARRSSRSCSQGLRAARRSAPNLDTRARAKYPAGAASDRLGEWA